MIRLFVLTFFVAFIFAQESVNLFTDSTSMYVLELEKSLDAGSKERMQHQIDMSKTVIVEQEKKVSFTDSNQIQLISARNATFQNLNWVRRHHDELNNTQMYGINPIGLAYVILKSIGAFKEEKASPITIKISPDNRLPTNQP
jgi:hypothetical protein